jgi:hypothetical protein
MILKTSSLYVQHKTTLYGWTSDKPVQIFVLSNDGKWYLQKNVVFVSNTQFFVECYFGDENTQHGAKFVVVAVVTDKRPYSPMTQLPPGITSPPLTVILGHNCNQK